jgi:CubicO group peptidase (beta-lactamase class C family)
MEKEPGKVHSYNNDAVALLSGIFPKVVGKQMDEYLRAKLFRPLKVEDWTWNRDESGTTVAYAELEMTARDLARIGRFVSRGGRAFRTPLLAEKWIDALGRPATDVRPDQGLLWRLILDGDEVLGVYHTGWLGQWIVVMPQERLVAVRLRRFEDQRETQETKYEFGRFLTLLRATLR